MHNTFKLLVISFYFPPCHMVSARRWAKHLKYMNADGIDFHVLSKNFPGERSAWTKDITTFENKIHRVDFEIQHPYFKVCLPKTASEKIKWKLSYWKWEYLSKRKNTLLGDNSIGSESLFLQKATEIIKKENITHVLMSVGPFYISTILPILKKKFSHLKITIDFRDYWHDNKDNIPEHMFKEQMKLQEQVLEAADTITVVNEEMKKHFLQLTENKKEVMVLPHCFDPDDIHFSKNTSTTKNNKLQFVYGGALYADMHNYIQLFIDLIKQLSADNLDSFSRILVPHRGYETELSVMKDKIEQSGFVNTKEYFELLQSCDAVLYFRPDWSPNAFSSKFFELVALRKPILYFGPKSDVSDFILKNDLGLHFSKENFENAYNEFKALLSGKKSINLNYDLTPHTFEANNQKLYKLFGIDKVKASA